MADTKQKADLRKEIKALKKRVTALERRASKNDARVDILVDTIDKSKRVKGL